jgi:hypothetical protein
MCLKVVFTRGWVTFLGIGMFTTSDDDWQSDIATDFPIR